MMLNNDLLTFQVTNGCSESTLFASRGASISNFKLETTKREVTQNHITPADLLKNQ